MPAAAAACGMRLVAVMPGSVFASRQKSSPAAVMRKSMRAHPPSLSAAKALRACACTLAVCSGERAAGKISSAIPAVYLHS